MSGASKRKAGSPRRIIRETLSDGSEALVAHCNGSFKYERGQQSPGVSLGHYDCGFENPTKHEVVEYPASPPNQTATALASVSTRLHDNDQGLCGDSEVGGNGCVTVADRDKNPDADHLHQKKLVSLRKAPTVDERVFLKNNYNAGFTKKECTRIDLKMHGDQDARGSFTVVRSTDRNMEVNSRDVGQENHKPAAHKTAPLLCEVCHVPFGSLDVLREHRRAAHGKKFQCKYCSKRFNDKYNMRKHVLIHVGEKKHKCEFCEKRFLRKDHLRSHLQTHYSRKFGCKICGRGFKTLDTYQKHVKVHKDDAYLSMTNNLDDMQPYIAASSSEPAQLADLDRSFTSEDGDALQRNDGSPGAEAACRGATLASRTPPLSFPSRDRSPSALHDDADAFASTGKSESIECLQHSGKHSEKDSSVTGLNLKGLKCNDCGSKFVDELSYRSHRSSCQLRSWPCGRCGITFDSASVLQQHCVKVHAMEQTSSNWKCKTCDVDFRNSKELSQHYASAHVDIQNFACSVCARKFIDRYNLKKHMLIHVGLKKHRCPVCDKGFVRKDHLNTHMKVHNRDVRFSCHVCAKSFRIKNLYHKHMNLHGLEGTVCQEELHSRLPHHDLHPVVDAM